MTLLIDREKIVNLKKFAEEHIIREEKCAEDPPGHVIYLPGEYRLVYSIKHCRSADKKKKLKYRHMTLSTLIESEEIDLNLIESISKLLGFSPLRSGKVSVVVDEYDPIPVIDIRETIEESII